MLEKIFPGGSPAVSVHLPLAFRLPDEKLTRITRSITDLAFLSHQIWRVPQIYAPMFSVFSSLPSAKERIGWEGSLMDSDLALGSEAGSMLKERTPAMPTRSFTRGFTIF